ncbi:MAG TPA: DUF3034 family protein [Candidatus Acidoferrales bacterium]|nr:DUF3034 family protein [Candidatus Acidoferrales bacterium]
MHKMISRVSFLLAAVMLLGCFASAQLNWEGQTGALLTPFAYTAASPANNFGKPVVAFHYLNAGSQIGNYMTFSVTEGVAKYLEVGYTRTFVSEGDQALSPLFKNGYDTFHMKANIVPENYGKNNWVPAIAIGGTIRTSINNVANNSKSNGDFYVVATKTVTQVKKLPFLVSAGYKYTNASIMGIAGNAPDFTSRAFGAAAVVLKGPAKSVVVVGAEAAQEPNHLKYVPGCSIPTSLSYFARVVPIPEKPINLDFAVVQAAGNINRALPSLDARARFGMGISYRF